MISASHRRPEEDPHWLSSACAWVALGAPLAVTVQRAAASTQWRDDVSVVRGLGSVPLGGEGLLSSLLIQLFSLLPIGGRLLRSALVSALALALCSWLTYLLARRTLHANTATSRLTPPLALGAALAATLSPSWQIEGTIAGGATLATALALTALLLRPRSDSSDAREVLAFGGLLAATALENHVAGLVLLAALGARIAVLGELPARRHVVLLLGGALASAALCVTPSLLWPLARGSGLDAGFLLAGARAAPAADGLGVVDASQFWLADLGMVILVAAGAALIIGLYRAPTRWRVAPLLVFCASDLLFASASIDPFAPDARVTLRLLALTALTVLSALGLQTLALILQRAKIPHAQSATGALVVFYFTLVLMTAEDSSYLADRRAQHAAEVWTDEALGSLPPGAALLVRSPAIALRLWSARTLRGERPDLLIVPLPMLEQSAFGMRLLAAEPALRTLIRDLAVSGKPSEYALSTLADARPLFIEFDARWDRRLFEHLLPRPLWVEFAPHALGRSDRKEGLSDSRRSVLRVREFAENPEYRDDATLKMLAGAVADQALLSALLADKDSARALLEDLKNLAPEHAYIAAIEARLSQPKLGRIDLTALGVR